MRLSRPFDCSCSEFWCGVGKQEGGFGKNLEIGFLESMLYPVISVGAGLAVFDIKRMRYLRTI